jgi:membrane associated rhomboid family serine protease
MKNVFRNLVSSLPAGARWFVLIFALSFPVAMAGHHAGLFNLYEWLALSPELVWKGQAWRMVTYAFLPSGLLDWLFGFFWLITLVLVVGRNWTGRGLWAYCLLAAFAGALPLAVLKPGMESAFTGNSAILFGLLVAWDRLYRRERLILLGIGEVSVRQAVILIALLNALVLLFCPGWFITLSMLCGGVAGWIYFAVRHRLHLGKRSELVESERIARLEL